MTEVKHCCGTCRRWDQQKEKARPLSLPVPGHGICQLDSKDRKANDMKDCMGWKVADPWDLDTREQAGII